MNFILISLPSLVLLSAPSNWRPIGIIFTLKSLLIFPPWMCLSLDEIKKRRFFDLGADKSLGLDDFSLLFYQYSWTLAEKDLLRFFSDLFYGSSSLDRINYAIVALIPKAEGASLVQNFRPISLLNCIFKNLYLLKNTI